VAPIGTSGGIVRLILRSSGVVNRSLGEIDKEKSLLGLRHADEAKKSRK
jgi:hypothetical protein